MRISRQDNEIMKNIMRSTVLHFESSLEKQGIKTDDIDIICDDISKDINNKSKQLIKDINEFALPSTTLLIAMKLILFYGEIYDELLEKVRIMREITKQQLDEEIRIENESRL